MKELLNYIQRIFNHTKPGAVCLDVHPMLQNNSLYNVYVRYSHNGNNHIELVMTNICNIIPKIIKSY